MAQSESSPDKINIQKRYGELDMVVAHHFVGRLGPGVVPVGLGWENGTEMGGTSCSPGFFSEVVTPISP